MRWVARLGTAVVFAGVCGVVAGHVLFEKLEKALTGASDIKEM